MNAPPDPSSNDAAEVRNTPDAGAEGGETEAAPKPRRRRTPKVAAEPSVEAAPHAAGESPSTVAVATPPDIVRPPREHEAQDAGQDVGGEVVTAPTRGDGEAQEGVAPTSSGSAPPEGERRGRNRRRRRDRHRDRPRADGAPVEGDAGNADAQAANGDDLDDDGEERELDEAARPPRPEPVDPGEVFAQVMSGAFDADVEVPEGAVPPRRILAPDPEALHWLERYRSFWTDSFDDLDRRLRG